MIPVGKLNPDEIQVLDTDRYPLESGYGLWAGMAFAVPAKAVAIVTIMAIPPTRHKRGEAVLGVMCRSARCVSE